MKSKIILAACLLTLSGRGMSQMVINIDTFREHALKNSEDIQIAESQKKQATGIKRAQRSLFLPRLSASGLYLYMDKKQKYAIEDTYLPTANFNPLTGELEPNLFIGSDGGPVQDPSGNLIFNSYAWIPAQTFSLALQNVYQYGLNLEQPVFMGGKILAANKMASTNEKISDIRIKDTHQKILLDADKKYWQYVAVSEQVKVAQKHVELLDSLISRVSDAVNTGLTHRNQLLKVQVKRNQAMLQLEKAQNGQQLLQMALCQKMGLALKTPIIVSDSTIEINPADFVMLTEGSLENRPDYQMLKKLIDLKKANEYLVQADFLPQIGVSASYNFLEGIKLNGQEILKADGNASVMVSAKVPLFHWGEGYNKVKAAKMETNIARTSLQKYEKLMILEIEQARLNLKEACSRYQTTEINLEQAEENLSLSRNGYNVGLEIITDYLEAQTQWQKAYASFIDSKADCKIRQSEYQKTIGQLKSRLN